MAHQVTEAIQHFIGYLHLAELLNLSGRHYQGAPTYTGFSLDEPAPEPRSLLPVSAPDAYVPQRLPSFEAGPGARLDPIWKSRSPAEEIVQSQFLPIPFIGSPSGPSPVVPAYGFEAGSVLPDISVRYDIGGRQDNIVDVAQRNALFDNDIVLDGETIIETVSLPPAVAALLQQSVHRLLDELPADLLTPFSRPGANDGLTMQIGKVGLNPAEAASAASSLGPVSWNGTYVDGIRTSDQGQRTDVQVDQLSSIADRMRADGELGSGRSPGVSAPSNVGIGDFSPLPVQEIRAGGNEQANVAMIYDLGDAFGSRIIRGDYHEINVIAQINLLAEDTAPGARTSPDSAANIFRNEASFVNEPGDVSGVVPVRGFNGATQWNVDYVNGSVFDVTMVRQSNFMADLDFVEVEQTQAYHLVTLGENNQFNVSAILEMGKTYDLIIVGGDYYKANIIVQVNILLDDDVVTHWGDSGKVSVASGDNLLENDAAIVGTGGQTFHGMTADVTALADAIAARQSTLDPNLTVGLPDNGDGVIDVLYVSGSYYNMNVIVQTNIIADLDQIEQRASSLDPVREQSVSSGGNAALNGALIVDLDSQTDYQFLGGEVYEESLLAQIDIIGDAEPADAPFSQDDDAIAVVAAMTDLVAAGEDHAPAIMQSPIPSADVLGSVLS